MAPPFSEACAYEQATFRVSNRQRWSDSTSVSAAWQIPKNCCVLAQSKTASCVYRRLTGCENNCQWLWFSKMRGRDYMIRNNHGWKRPTAGLNFIFHRT